MRYFANSTDRRARTDPGKIIIAQRLPLAASNNGDKVTEEIAVIAFFLINCGNKQPVHLNFQCLHSVFQCFLCFQLAPG